MKGRNMAILDAYGKKAKRGTPVLREIGTGTVRDMYSSYPSHGLTPDRLASILREADQGNLLRQAELFEEMEEKDAHLGSVLQTRKLAVSGLDWEVVAAGKGGQEKETADFIKDAISRIGNWDSALLDLLDAVGKGFSVSELMWEVSGGRVWIREILWRNQKMFTFFDGKRMARAPRLLTENDPAYGEDLPPNKFVVHMSHGRSGLSARGGMLRPCAYMYLFKNYALKDWVIFNERFAMPMRVGKFSAGASESERRTLRNAVFNLGTDAAAVISDSTVIELLDSEGKGASADIYGKLVEFCDRSVSKAVLGHTGSAESTPGRLGSEHEAREVRQDILEADAKALQKTIATHIIRPLVQFNFGPGASLPLFKFHYEAEEDLKVAAETYRTLKELGVEIPEAFLCERFGIPGSTKGDA
jgi:phage gp29-like protein